jgi:ribonuclease-3
VPISEKRRNGLESVLGYRFRDESLLENAVTHPSAVKEGRSAGPDNQRLEFLGDAVLQLVVSTILMERYPESTEGDLSFIRAEMVRKEYLADIGERLELENLLKVGPSLDGAPRVGIRSILADSVEALVGAIFLDGGWESAVSFVGEVIGDPPEPGEDLKGSKSNLQEIIQKNFAGDVPRYEVSECRENSSEKRFKAVVYHREKVLGAGDGRSKKRAEEAAAESALEALRNL